MIDRGPCSILGCANDAWARQMCHKHLRRWYDGRDVEREATQTLPEVDRFWRYVEKGPHCWMWRGGLTGAGYGVFSTGSRPKGTLRSKLAHRYAYELLVGPIATGKHLDHLCRETACVRPAHLEPVSPRDNTLRGIGPSALNEIATECKRGHLFSAENTYVDKRGERHCRACTNYRARRRRANLSKAEFDFARTAPDAA
jgi:hypothetical protein